MPEPHLHSPRHHASLAALAGHVGNELGVSDWFDVRQDRIDRFAEATGDRQWIHVDPVRAMQGPFGCTVAHGYLTLSLLPAMAASAWSVGSVRMAMNYGLNRLRFPAPVPAESQVRGRFILSAFEPMDGGAQLSLAVLIERQGGFKPVCAADVLLRYFT